MDTKKLRQKILDLAIHGKLVPQDPNDEPASVLLERIRKEKEQLIKEGKIKAPKKSKSAGDTSHYPKEGPFVVPSEWALSTVKDVFTINPKNSAADELLAGFVPMASISDGFSNSFEYDNRTWKEIKSGFTHFADGDVAVAKISPCLENRKSFVARNLPNGIGSGTTELLVFRSRIILPEFTLLFFKSAYFISACVCTFNGVVGQQRADRNVIEDLVFPIPPLQEQKRIVKEVKQLFDRINEIDHGRLDIKASVEKAKSKILSLAIQGKIVPQNPAEEPAVELLRRINPAFIPSHNLHYETQQLFTLPNGWEWCSVKDYSKKVTDYVASGSFASLKDNVRYYKQPNYAILIKTKDFANNFSEDLTYTDEKGYNFLKNSNLYGGELVFSNVGSVGKIFKVPHLNIRMSLAPNAIMVKFHQDDQSAWFERVFQSPFGQESLRAIASATAIMKFNKTDFGKLLIPVPPVSEQKRILDAIDAFLAQLDCINDTE